MGVLIPAAVCLLVLAGITLLFRRSLAVAAAGERLEQSIDLFSSRTDVASIESSTTDDLRQTIRPLARPLRWLPPAIGVLVSVSLLLMTSIPLSICLSIGLVLSLMLSQLEGSWHQWRLSRIERQLIDLLDMMIPMLRSGAGASAALTAASEVTGSPLRGQIDWCVRRIQLGDSGSQVFQTLAKRMPID
ncbi:MAG: pilus assembly protein TadB, partial [Planctomycetota bacterium]